MARLKRSRPSPALVVGVLALVAALAGTAVAADPVATTSVSKKKTKKIAKKQAIKQIDLAFDDAFPVGGDELGAIDEHSQSTTITANTTGTAEATCDDPGERVISGGWRDNAPATTTSLAVPYEDHRTANATGWRASAIALGTDRTITAFAYCIEP
jgi:hypothetical protein